MNERNSLKGSNCNSPKSILLKKMQNLKKSDLPKRNSLFLNLSKLDKIHNITMFKSTNINNKKNRFSKGGGKTSKVSPINYHNKIVGYMKQTKKKDNKKAKNNIFEKSNFDDIKMARMKTKSTSKPKAKIRPKEDNLHSKSKSKSKTNNILNNIYKPLTKYARITNIKINKTSKEENKTGAKKDDNHAKRNEIKKKMRGELIWNFDNFKKKKNNNKILNNNPKLISEIKNNKNNIAKKITNFASEKRFHNIKPLITAIQSKKNSKEKNKKNPLDFFSKINCKIIKNSRKNNYFETKAKRSPNNINSQINNTNVNLHKREKNINSLLYKYSFITKEMIKSRRKKGKHNINNINNIKSLQNSYNDRNSCISKTYGGTKIKSGQRSSSKMNSKKNKNKNLICRYFDNISIKFNNKFFPITTTQTHYNLNEKKNTETRKGNKTKSNSRSNNKSKSRNSHKNKFKTKENNNMVNSSIKKRQSKYNSKRLFEARHTTSKNKKTHEKKRGFINNIIFNILPAKNNNQGLIKLVLNNINNINQTYSMIQKENSSNLYPKIITTNNIKESKNKINNYNHEETSSIFNNKDFVYYKDESAKLSKKIKQYGKAHNYLEYPKTSLEFYKIGRSIGHGAFGKVNIALHVLSGHIVSIKSFNKKRNDFSLSKIQNEAKIMKKLKVHKNIVTFLELFETEEHYCLVMENVVGGNLLYAINKMGRIPENLAKIIFKQLVLTLEYIHSKNIVHRDIKTDNILLDLDNTIKICDFGISKIIPKGQLIDDSCGTPAFIAPEILLDGLYDPYMTDIWSSGVVLYAMVTGFFPFKGINEHQLNENIIKGNFPQPINVSEDLNDLLLKILNTNPKQRITLKEILLHPWLSDNIPQTRLDLKLFTKAEQVIYGKLKLDYRKMHKDIELENFTNKNIDSYYEEANQNNKSMSFIFTPHNTKREVDEDDDLYYEDVNIEDNIMKFMPKAQELSRLYEVKNNFEFDQGFIVEKKNNKKKVSMEQSYDENQNNIVLNKNKVNKRNKDIININEAIFNTHSSVNNNVFIDPEALKYVENFGYKKDYIVKSIEANEVNHASATYFIKIIFPDT